MRLNPNDQPKSYIKQVFDNPLFICLLVACAFAVLYTGSLLVFADWQQYDDPFGSRRNAVGALITAAVILVVSFVVPWLNKEDVSARRTHTPNPDESGFYRGQEVMYRGYITDHVLTPATYQGPDDMTDGLLVVIIKGHGEQIVPVYSLHKK